MQVLLNLRHFEYVLFKPKFSADEDVRTSPDTLETHLKSLNKQKANKDLEVICPGLVRTNWSQIVNLERWSRPNPD